MDVLVAVEFEVGEADGGIGRSRAGEGSRATIKTAELIAFTEGRHGVGEAVTADRQVALEVLQTGDAGAQTHTVLDEFAGEGHQAIKLLGPDADGAGGFNFDRGFLGGNRGRHLRGLRFTGDQLATNGTLGFQQGRHQIRRRRTALGGVTLQQILRLVGEGADFGQADGIGRALEGVPGPHQGGGGVDTGFEVQGQAVELVDQFGGFGGEGFEDHGIDGFVRHGSSQRHKASGDGQDLGGGIGFGPLVIQFHHQQAIEGRQGLLNRLASTRGFGGSGSEDVTGLPQGRQQGPGRLSSPRQASGPDQRTAAADGVAGVLGGLQQGHASLGLGRCRGQGLGIGRDLGVGPQVAEDLAHVGGEGLAHVIEGEPIHEGHDTLKRAREAWSWSAAWPRPWDRRRDSWARRSVSRAMPEMPSMVPTTVAASLRLVRDTATMPPARVADSLEADSMRTSSEPAVSTARPSSSTTCV